MLAAEVLVRILEQKGITDACGIPGAGINPVYKYLKDSPAIKHYTMRHEEAAVHTADAYFRASGKLALGICNSGPGATNFITGLYTAWIDSFPLIAITGQTSTPLLGKDAFQCVHIASIARPVTKATWCVTEAKELSEVLRKAFHTEPAGIPGPVLIDFAIEMKENKDLIDHIKVADGFVCKAKGVTKPEEIKPALDWANQHQGPSVIEVLVEECTDCSMGISIDSIKEFQ